MSRPVHIAGSGLLCALGDSPGAAAAALWAGASPAGEIDLGERRFPYFRLPLAGDDWLRRAETAVRHVVGQLGPLAAGTPLFVASSSFQVGHFENLARGADALPELPPASAAFSRQIAGWAGLSGPRHSFSNACISGFSAIDAAAGLIAAGRLDEAVVIGVELANRLTVAGFAAMELLSRDAARPLDAERDGLVLGEAVAAVRLSAAPAAWRIAGLRTGIDAYSTTGPDPDGGPIAEVVADSLRAAGLAPADIDLIKLQAAGSPGTDLAEANGLRRVFADMPPLLSLKPAIGHTLGASGIAESAMLLASLEAGQIPATAGFATPDPAIGLRPAPAGRADIRRALLNLIGFGGGLAAMIVEKAA